MEYCRNCGSVVNEESGCCTVCGLRSLGTSKKKNTGLVKIAVIFFAAVTLILALYAYSSSRIKLDFTSGDDYMKVTEELINALYVDFKLEDFFAYMPRENVEELIDIRFKGTVRTFNSVLKAGKENLTKEGIPENVTWKINEEQDLPGTEIDYYQYEYNYEKKIEALKVLDVLVSYSRNGEHKEENVYLLLALMDGRWYLINSNAI